MDIRFVWDENKNTTNLKKHKVSFEEAKTVFLDDSAQIIYDPDHSEHEDRFVLLGMSIRLRILVVCYCYRENDEIIRIISARKATKKEEKQYYAKRI
ncbi:MAG: BrnT family toxin [Candidatus Omnitrophica bacterium]|nr:BrnT family toxin [Candidatus Omnitrophota bacterium]